MHPLTLSIYYQQSQTLAGPGEDGTVFGGVARLLLGCGDHSRFPATEAKQTDPDCFCFRNLTATAEATTAKHEIV